MSRTTPDGIELAWQLLFLRDDHMPFFIDWQNSPHPALSTPSGCRLSDFSISADNAETYQSLMMDLNLQHSVTDGLNAFSAQLQTPKGEVTLTHW